MKLSELLEATYAEYWKGSKSEADSVRNARNVLYILGDMEIDSIRVAQVLEIKQKMRENGKAAGTINRTLAALSKMLKHAQLMEWLPSIPIIPREKEAEARCRVLSDDEIERLGSYMMSEHADIILFLVETGMRVSEMARLTFHDLTFDGAGDAVFATHATLRQTKGGKVRRIPISTIANEVLDRVGYGRDFDRVFPGFSQSQFNHDWNYARNHVFPENERAEIVPHALRHTCASRLAAKGAGLSDIKEWLGHANIQTTMRYVHLIKGLERFVE